jgi:pimeloyl-ACP methyl ester carboxylesterase
VKRHVLALAFLACAIPAAAEEAVVNGFRMHYEDHGRGPAVVLLHGFTLDSRMREGRAHLVGLSMGASYALETALRYPDRVLSLTLASAAVQGIKTPPEAMAAFMKGVQAYPSEGAEGFRRAWLADPLFAQVSAKPMPRKELETMVAAYNVDALFKVMGKVKPPGPPTQLDRLGEVKAPTLIMIGGLDAPHMLQAGEEAAKRIPAPGRSSTLELGT